jgi:phospholipid/cholesterol/gamma-HCH transport system substrate-binding protein
LKYSREIKTGVVAIIAIVVLVAGVNFLKGNSFFGGDQKFYAYFPNSGQLMVSSNVTLDGVIVGKVLNIENLPTNPQKKRVKITFSLQNESIQLPKGTIVEIGALDFLTKGLMVNIPENYKQEFFKPGSVIPGRLMEDMMSQVKQYADPITKQLSAMMINVDKMVGSLSSFWDDKATSQIESSLKQIKITIEKLGNVASEIEDFVGEEKKILARVMGNVESITHNLKKSNEQITAIVGNTKKLTDDFVSADFKSVLLDAQTTIQKLNLILTAIEKGEGSIGKLLNDETLHTELIETINADYVYILN